MLSCLHGKPKKYLREFAFAGVVRFAPVSQREKDWSTSGFAKTQQIRYSVPIPKFIRTITTQKGAR